MVSCFLFHSEGAHNSGRLCGRCRGACSGDSTSPACRGSSDDGLLLNLSRGEVQARCTAEPRCVGYLLDVRSGRDEQLRLAAASGGAYRLMQSWLPGTGRFRGWLRFDKARGDACEERRIREAAQAERAWQLSNCVMRKSRSQLGEDLLLWPTLAHNAAPGGGTFVELGAWEGEALSNTFMLEACLGWRGTLIEAEPRAFARLNASARRRAGNVLVHAAVCGDGDGDDGDGDGDGDGARTATARFSSDNGGHVLGGGAGRPPPRAEGSRGAGHVRLVRSADTHVAEVPCRTLRAIVRDTAASAAATAASAQIDFLSLDVEGAEELALRGADPQRFKLVMVELDGTNPQKDERARELLVRAGLRRARSLVVPHSEVWVHGDVREVPLRGAPTSFVRRHGHTRCGDNAYVFAPGGPNACRYVPAMEEVDRLSLQLAKQF